MATDPERVGMSSPVTDDGKTILVGGTYYQFAASYGLPVGKEPAGDSGCANTTIGAPGFRIDHNVSMWTSPDLATWTPHGAVLQMTEIAPALGVANAILFCPKVRVWARLLTAVPLAGD